MTHRPDIVPCDVPLIHLLFSVIGRLGIFGILLNPEQDLTLNQLRVLFRLYYRGPLTMGQIADMLDVSNPTATGTIDRLVTKGLVERTIDPADRRLVRVQLSQIGRDDVMALRRAGGQRVQTIVSQLSSLQQEALYEALEPLYQLLLSETAP